MQWRLVESGPLPPAAIMAKDSDLLQRLNAGDQPILHLYEWQGRCLTYGHFTDPFAYLKADRLNFHEIDMARRPTGGGIIFHLTDLAFSVLIPASSPLFSLNVLSNYQGVNCLVGQAILQYMDSKEELTLLAQEPVCASQACRSFCMAKPTQYDIMLNGKKIGGAAQRKTKNGFLHQGSVSLALPPLALLEDILKEDKKVIKAMRSNSCALLDGKWSYSQLESARLKLKRLLRVNFTGDKEASS